MDGFKAKWNLHNTEISTSATQFSMTPLVIIRWDRTCLNRSNMVLNYMPGERHLIALLSAKAHLVTHMILSKGDKIQKDHFDYALLLVKK